MSAANNLVGVYWCLCDRMRGNSHPLVPLADTLFGDTLIGTIRLSLCPVTGPGWFRVPFSKSKELPLT